MKNYLLAIIISITTLCAKAQVPVDRDTEKVTYTDVVTVDGDKDDLFKRCVYWLNETYSNPASVTSIRDYETGKIKGSHRFKLYVDNDGFKKASGMVVYNFTIEFKDGKYRYTLTDFYVKKGSKFYIEQWLNKSDPQYSPVWDNYLSQIDTFAKDWISGLKEMMLPPKPKVDKSQW
ncbi:MAG: DUF4468 domain-containing protein [Hyphomicrobiales bacterium]